MAYAKFCIDLITSCINFLRPSDGRASTRFFCQGLQRHCQGLHKARRRCAASPTGAKPLGSLPPQNNFEKMVQFGAIWRILSGVWWTNEVYKICFKNDWIMKIFFFIIVFLKNLINILLFYFFRFLGVAKFATICRRCIQCRDGKNKSSAVWSTHTYYIQIMTSHNYLALTWHTEI